MPFGACPAMWQRAERPWYLCNNYSQWGQHAPNMVLITRTALWLTSHYLWKSLSLQKRRLTILYVLWQCDFTINSVAKMCGSTARSGRTHVGKKIVASMLLGRWAHKTSADTLLLPGTAELLRSWIIDRPRTSFPSPLCEKKWASDFDAPSGTPWHGRGQAWCRWLVLQPIWKSRRFRPVCSKECMD